MYASKKLWWEICTRLSRVADLELVTYGSHILEYTDRSHIECSMWCKNYQSKCTKARLFKSWGVLRPPYIDPHPSRPSVCRWIYCNPVLRGSKWNNLLCIMIFIFYYYNTNSVCNNDHPNFTHSLTHSLEEKRDAWAWQKERKELKKKEIGCYKWKLLLQLIATVHIEFTLLLFLFCFR